MIYDPTGVNYVMNTLQAASYLGVPSDLIDTMVEKGTIPFTKVGDRTVFSKAALDQAAVSLLQPGNQLTEVHRPADAHHTVGEEPRIIRIPVGVAKALEGRKAKVVGNARDPAMPGALTLRLVQLLRHRGICTSFNLA